MTNKKYAKKIKSFFELSRVKQAEWIENNIPDFEMYCHGEGYLGAFYPVEIDLSNYLNDRNEYKVSGLILKQDPEIANGFKKSMLEQNSQELKHTSFVNL